MKDKYVLAFFLFLCTLGSINGFSQELKIDTLIIGVDTIYMQKPQVEVSSNTLLKCTGNIGDTHISFIARSDKNPNFQYAFGTSKKDYHIFQDHFIPLLTIVLIKNNAVEDVQKTNFYFSTKVDVHFYNPEGIRTMDNYELWCYHVSQPFCGGSDETYVFGRRENKLIPGFSFYNQGEPGMEYSYQEIVKPDANILNQFWLETKVGKEKLEYFTTYTKYGLMGEEMICLNPKTDSVMFVNAANGLRMRSEPSIQGDTLSLLPYGSKVVVKNRTKISTTVNHANEKITGNWVQIVHPNDSLLMHSVFVFDGFLQQEPPKKGK